MKALLDENMPHKLRHALPNVDLVTVQYLGWSGLKNGELLDKAEAADFDVLVTGDKTIEYEQNMKDRKIAVVSLSAPHWPLVKPHVSRIVFAIKDAAPGSFTRVQVGTFQRSRKS